MKWMKRATALLLCFLMLTNGPISAFATERTDNIVVETTATTETEEVCEECGGSDAHTETCSYNTVTSLTMEAPAVTTEPTTTPTAATGSAISTDPVGCAECGQTEGHSTECSQYEAPVEDIVKSTGPQVGDKIWIRKGAKVYRNLNSDKSWTLLGNYEVKIVEIETDEDGNPQWYRFEFTTLGLGEVLLHGYKYVAAADTSEEEPEPSEPVDENACNCGENAPENIADHADSCPRKQYIKTLFEGKTAEEIYAQWETYDEATQTDLLNMLQKWDNEKYEELKNLVSGASTEQTVDDMTFTSTVPVTVKSTADTKRTAITGAAPFMDSEKEYHFFDIDANSAEETEITVSGLVTDNQNKSVVVLHLLDSADAILAAQKNGMGIDYFTVSDASEFAEEVNAANDALGVSNRVYYTFAEAKMDANGDISFKTDSFSTFVFVVTFGYDGYNYDLMGKGSIYLSDLMRGLGMSQNVSTVTDVSFSDPSLLTIEKNQNDWVLTSLNAFSSTEWLEITFSNGQTVKIKVTDPILKYYLDGNSNWNMGTKSSAITPSGATSLGSKITNDPVITADEVAKAANSNPNDVDLVIYARPGMAIGFQSGTNWEYGSWYVNNYNNNKYKNTNWEWIWDGSVNYALLTSSSTSVTTAEFKLTVDDKTCTVRIYIIPNAVTLPDTDQPSKVKDTLGADPRYAVKTLPVTLYNYDGKLFNQYYANRGSWLAFHGVSLGQSADVGFNLPWTEAYLPNSGSNSTGIMKDRLENNLPVMASTDNTDLFSTTKFDGKEVYQNVGFEYIYDTQTGYYTYSSNLNHAQFNGSNLIELYNQTLAPVIGNSQNSKAGFYPFADINTAIKNYSGTEHTNWQGNLETDYFQQNAQYVQDLVSTGTVSTADHPSAVSTVDMHFGLQLEADFYMPIGRQVDANGDGNKEELIYTFTGDDDLWVYVDDQLVLDLGGAHTAISGTINFTKQTVTLGEYHKVTATGNKYTLADGESGTNKIYTFDELGITVSEDQMHTMRVFYLERWSGESNCRMRFNLPLLPSNAVRVSKNLTNQEDKELSVTPDVNYTFTLYTAADNDDVIDATNFAPAAGATYTVIGTGAPTGTQRTNDRGQFTLKDGWAAVFTGIQRFTEVYVVESEPEDDYQYVGSTISVNNGSPTEYTFGENSETKVMPSSDKGISFSFTNKMQTQPLKIEKQVVNGTQGLINPDQKFTFTLDFKKNILETGEGAIKADNSVTLTDGGTFQLGHNESIRIPRVPVNMTFTLKEANPDPTNKSFDAPKFESTICTTTDTPNAFDEAYTWTMSNNGENKIVVTNQQRFNLTIIKEGIQNADHDNDEQQSTIYTIVGEADNNELVKMDVAICGNGSVTVCKLPVGSYTVQENTDWAWRYDPQGEATRTVDIPQSANADVTYNNNRTNQNWLSGDSYCENWWGSNGNVVRKNVNN